MQTEWQDTKRILELVVLEQFIAWLPAGTVEWVQCHQVACLDEDLQLVVDHLVVTPVYLSLCLSSSSSLSSPSSSRSL